MNHKAQKLFGKVRICGKRNLTWHGFILQRGHFFGIDKQGYFVSGLLTDRNGQVKVYRAEIATEQWRVDYIKKQSQLAQKLMEASIVHKQIGIERAEFVPSRQQLIPDVPYMRQSGRVYPWTPMHIPCPGTGNKTGVFVSV